MMVIGKVFKCPKFGMECDRDMNTAIALRVMSTVGQGFCEQLETAYEGSSVKSPPNAGSHPQVVVHCYLLHTESGSERTRSGRCF